MSFNTGLKPTICCINKATVPLGQNYRLKTLVEAMQIYLDHSFVPAWGTPAHLGFAYDFVPGTWALVFLDNADQADALGYHDLTPDGYPLGKVFVKTTQMLNDEVSVTASHELLEMLVDPAINLCAVGPDEQTLYAYEVADAVEDSWTEVNGIPLSNFVFPSWFESFRAAKSTRFDYLGKCTHPFQILRGGYMPVFKNGQWTEIFGSEQSKEKFAKYHRAATRVKPKRLSTAPSVPSLAPTPE